MWQWGVVAFILAAAPPADEAEAAAERARSTLAERLHVETETVEVVEVEPAEWPNAALGCPVPGRVYAQVLTSGYRVTLRVEGGSRSYHVAGERVVTCPKIQDGGTGTLPLGPFERVTVEARRDLAGRLGIEEGEVVVLRVRPATRTTLVESGCPPPADLDPAPRQGETLFLFLQAKGTTHRYRADRERLTYCGAPR